MVWTIWYFCLKFRAPLWKCTHGFFSYPGAVAFDKKIPENVMHVQSNFFVALVVMVAFTRYFLAHIAKLTRIT